MIVAGILICLGALGYVALCGVNYSFRRTYMRPVHFAVQEGQDPYQAALVCAQDMAGGQMWMAGWFAGAVFVLGGVVTTLAVRRAK